MQKKIFTTMTLLPASLICFAQDKVETHTLNYDPEKLKILPDKVFEVGLPMLFLFILLNTIVSILKNRAENKLKLKMVEKEVSEETLIKVFKESNVIARIQPLKWFLFTSAMAISLIIIHFSREYLIYKSGYLALGIFLLFLSIAFLIYYRILQNK